MEILNENPRQYEYIKVWEMGGLYRLVVFKSGSPSGRKPTQEQIDLAKVDSLLDERSPQSRSRAKRNVRELVLCNEWDYFVTLTLRQDRYDLAKFKRDFGVWVGNFNKKYNTKLRYLVIPEEHKDGATHAHGVFAGVPRGALTLNENGYLDMPYYRNRFGFISLGEIHSQKATAFYITKYITKAPHSQLKKGEQMFFCSHGLNKATCAGVFAVPPALLPTPDYENEYVSITTTDVLPPALSGYINNEFTI